MNIIPLMIQALKDKADRIYQKSVQCFFLEPIDCYGVRKDIVKDIAKKYFAMIKHEPKAVIFEQCKELLSLGKQETFVIACVWALALKKQFEPSDFAIFNSSLDAYVTNWASCDDLCGGPLGILLKQYPELIAKTNLWVQSKNRWKRRASAVVLIYSGQTPDQLPIILKRCEQLLQDEDVMVQKGYGWLLKKTSARYQQEVFDFVMTHKKMMPRLALRYAIEKMPTPLKKRAMD